MLSRQNVEVLEEVSNSGSLFGGMQIIFAKDGEVSIEAWHELCDEDEVFPWSRFAIYRVDVPEDVYAEHTWVKASAIGGGSEEEGRDPDPRKRAWQIILIAEHYGWEEFDQYPLRLTATELYQRWGNHPSEDPRRDYLDELADAPLVQSKESLDAFKPSQNESDHLEAEGVKRLYGALLSSKLGGWNFARALLKAVEQYGKTYDADAVEDFQSWRVNQTIEHVCSMSFTHAPPEGTTCVVFNLDKGAAKAALSMCTQGEVLPRWCAMPPEE